MTVQIGLRAGSAVRTVRAGESIQAAIDAAGVNDLILVAPGTYSEMVIMYKPVQLQGWGEGTIISATLTPAEKLAAWREKILILDAANAFDPVDGQGDGFAGVQAGAFDTEEGAGILVLANNGTGTGLNIFSAPANQGARIDGFTIRSASIGGGIVVNGFVDYLDISNNRIIGNSGFFGGGVRIGHPFLTFQSAGEELYTDSDNDFIHIHNNVISQNGGLSGAGGGLSLYNGTDDYIVSNNFICGNFTLRDGAGIAHLGLSDNGVIQENTILFNENFNQMVTVNGGGLSISGLASLDQAVSPGAGSVQVVGNLIQGNSAGSGDGGGIRLNRINGLDVAGAPANQASWYTVDIINNMVVNNVAALAGGGVSLQDALRVTILHNTIANNDNTSTASEAFVPGVLNQSTAQPGAGIASRSNSAELMTVLAVLPSAEDGFSNPVLEDNIIWHNRKFSFLIDDTDPASVLTGLCPDIGASVGLSCPSVPDYDDLAVLPLGSGAMNPVSSILTGNPDPQFVFEYINGNREISIGNPEAPGAIQPAAAFDEGGNFIRLRYVPLTRIRLAGTSIGELYGDYHLQLTSPAINAGIDTGVADDFDRQARPFEIVFDIGADEVQQPAVSVAAPQVAIAQLALAGGSLPQVTESAVVEPVPSLAGGEVVRPEEVAAGTTIFSGQPVINNELIAEIAPADLQGEEAGLHQQSAKDRLLYAGHHPRSLPAVRETEPERGEWENAESQSLPPVGTGVADSVVQEQPVELAGWIPPLYEDDTLTTAQADLKATRVEVKYARKNMEKAIEHLARVQEKDAPVQRDLERAAEDLERAMFELKRTVADLKIVTDDLEQSLEKQEAGRSALKKARRELAKAKKVMTRAVQDLANVNLKG